ncbi:MAG: ferrochelatase, partial [Chlamydiae bacterium]|nr:ferrochelatase [Chlamydiota bacterium]
MLKSNIALLVVNFGGPRSLEEVLDFLQALLTDDAIIQTPFPRRLQHMFFRRVAYKRAKKVRDDYTLIGGKSPIFEDTEWFAKKMEEKLQIRTLAFHRYLEKTHHAFLSSMEMLDVDKFCVFPLFPQFSKATTGSIMDWLSTHLPTSTVQKLCWIHSYSTHPGYIRAFVQTVQDFLQEKSLQEEEI